MSASMLSKAAIGLGATPLKVSSSRRGARIAAQSGRFTTAADRMRASSVTRALGVCRHNTGEAVGRVIYTSTRGVDSL